jgi:HK97 family phage prohead protease
MSTLLEHYQLDVPMAITLAGDDLGEYEFDGYASVFGSVNAYGFCIDSGAFAKTLKERPNPVLLWQHWSDQPIGKITSAVEDAKGLKIRAQLVPEVEQARAAHALMKAGAIEGLSIGFRVVKSAYESGKGIDHVTELKLGEVSVVTFAADPKAKIGRVLSEIQGLTTLTRDGATRADFDRAIAQLIALRDQAEPGDSSTLAALEPQTVTAIQRQLAELNLLREII